MSRFFYAQKIARPEKVIPYLAKQELHWKKGYSAYELAHSWISAGGIPASVRSVLDTCPDYAGAQLIEGLFVVQSGRGTAFGASRLGLYTWNSQISSFFWRGSL